MTHYRPGQQRDRPLEVMSLGMSRTGTRSMADALSILGYDNVAHGFDLLDDLMSPYIPRWEQAINAKFGGRGKPFDRADWDELLGRCGAVTDIPCIYFWRELLEAYPDAKVILVQRDEDAWLPSFREIVIDAPFTLGARFSRFVVEPILGIRLGQQNLTMQLGYFEAKDQADFLQRAKIVYRQHYQDIRATVPKERLLEYELGSGWEPLCAFLGKPVPAQEFPWLNERAELSKRVAALQVKIANDAGRLLFGRILPAIVGLASIAVAWRIFGFKSISFL